MELRRPSGPPSHHSEVDDSLGAHQPSRLIYAKVAAHSLGAPVSATFSAMTFTIELDREGDGRWIAEVEALPGVMCYGRDRDEAVARVQALALRVIAERLEHGEAPAELLNVTFRAA